MLKKLLPTVTILLVLVGITASSMLLMTPPDSSAMPLLDVTPTEPPLVPDHLYRVGVYHTTDYGCDNCGFSGTVDDIDSCYTCKYASSHLNTNKCTQIPVSYCRTANGFAPDYVLYWANGEFRWHYGLSGQYFFGSNFVTDEYYGYGGEYWWEYPVTDEDQETVYYKEFDEWTVEAEVHEDAYWDKEWWSQYLGGLEGAYWDTWNVQFRWAECKGTVCP